MSGHVLTQLGWYDVEVDGCELAMELPISEAVANERGNLQGGLIATLVDVVAGRLALRGMAPDASVSTSDMHLRYLAPVRVGPARAEAYVMRRGSRSIVLRVDVYDAASEVLSTVSTIAFSVMTPLPHKLTVAPDAAVDATGLRRAT